MPKSSRRSKAAKDNLLGDHLFHIRMADSDADASSLECASIRSNRSSRADQLQAFDDFADDGFGDDNVNDFESKMLENLDLICEKSAKTRCKALTFVKNGITGRYLSYFVNDRKATLIDAVERSLKKGKSDEQQIATGLASVVFITLGPTDDTDALFKQLYPLLLTSLQDNSLPAPVRAQCAWCLAIGCFIVSTGPDLIDSIMAALYEVFSASFLKGNGVAPTLNAATVALHSNALTAWTLLLTVCPPHRVQELTDKNLFKIMQLLQSSDLDMRLAAGECIAFMNEIAQESDHTLNREHLDELCDLLLQLSKDCQKFRAKKDLKVQRSSFRDILKSVSDGENSQTCIRIGREKLQLHSWRKRLQYEMFCNLLGTGMNVHLTYNELFRDIFELGPILFEDKLQRHGLHREWLNENALIEKARHKRISKLRAQKFVDQ